MINDQKRTDDEQGHAPSVSERGSQGYHNVQGWTHGRGRGSDPAQISLFSPGRAQRRTSFCFKAGHGLEKRCQFAPDGSAPAAIIPKDPVLRRGCHITDSRASLHAARRSGVVIVVVFYMCARAAGANRRGSIRERRVCAAKAIRSNIH